MLEEMKAKYETNVAEYTYAARTDLANIKMRDNEKSQPSTLGIRTPAAAFLFRN